MVLSHSDPSTRVRERKCSRNLCTEQEEVSGALRCWWHREWEGEGGTHGTGIACMSKRPNAVTVQALPYGQAWLPCAL